MRTITVVVVALATAGLHPPPAGADDHWNQFRGPSGDGRSAAAKLPTAWGEADNVLWKTPIHDKGWASPVVWGEQIWLTTAREDGKEFFAVCVDRASGKVVHDLKVFTEEKPAFCHAFNSYASPTPVVEAGRAYVHFGSHGTACLDTATGKVLWERRDLKCDHFRGPASSPVVHGNLLYLIFDGFDLQYVAALDKTTGKTVWKQDRNIKYSSSNGDFKKAYATAGLIPVGGKLHLVCPSAEQTVAYDPATGDELWRVTHGGMNGSARPVAAHGLVYLTSGHNANLLAVTPGTGTLPESAVAWRAKREVPSRPSLVLDGDYIYMIDDKGMASCLDAKTGEAKWKERLGGEYSASPLVAAGHVYFFGQDGRTFVVEAKPALKIVATNKLESGFMASPAVAGGELLLRTKTHLYCIR